jgi:hypothetical protein
MTTTKIKLCLEERASLRRVDGFIFSGKTILNRHTTVAEEVWVQKKWGYDVVGIVFSSLVELCGSGFDSLCFLDPKSLVKGQTLPPILKSLHTELVLEAFEVSNFLHTSYNLAVLKYIPMEPSWVGYQIQGPVPQHF